MVVKITLLVGKMLVGGVRSSEDYSVGWEKMLVGGVRGKREIVA